MSDDMKDGEIAELKRLARENKGENIGEIAEAWLRVVDESPNEIPQEEIDND